LPITAPSHIPRRRIGVLDGTVLLIRCAARSWPLRIVQSTSFGRICQLEFSLDGMWIAKASGVYHIEDRHAEEKFIKQSHACIHRALRTRMLIAPWIHI
jgi:hypothetical protein